MHFTNMVARDMPRSLQTVIHH